MLAPKSFISRNTISAARNEHTAECSSIRARCRSDGTFASVMSLVAVTSMWGHEISSPSQNAETLQSEHSDAVLFVPKVLHLTDEDPVQRKIEL